MKGKKLLIIISLILVVLSTSCRVIPGLKVMNEDIEEVTGDKIESVYYLIVGSFREKSNAEAMVLNLKQQGFDCEILISKKGLNRVSVYSNDAKNNAYDKILEIRKNFTEYSDVWLLIN